jgi:hypothetical protein
VSLRLFLANAVTNAHGRYQTTIVDGSVVKPVEHQLKFRTERQVPKVRCVWCVCGDVGDERNP